jgi:dolichyl-phosphate-mannose-protein mannosyltransferase
MLFRNTQFSARSRFSIAIFAIFLFALVTRFWGLTRFNTLVFDEVYYAKFANNYLTGTEFFNSHPPVAQYLIALGIWLGSFFSASSDTINSLTDTELSTFSYRWFNALFGAFIPIFIAYIAYYLTNRYSYGVIAALFAALDGLFLVESRYALSNIYIVFFGLLGQLFFLLALRGQSVRGASSQKKTWALSLAGICLGASIGTKWNGLGFAFGLYLILMIIAGIKLIDRRQKKSKSPHASIGRSNKGIIIPKPWQNIDQYNSLDIIGNLVILPLITYSLLWIPHLIMNPQFDFIAVHEQMLSYHKRMGDGRDIHPYCSPWYSWTIMWRPIAYFFQTAVNFTDSIPASPPLPSGVGRIIYSVYAMGNPLLWWLSTAAMILLIFFFCQSFLPRMLAKNLSHLPTWMVIYLVCNYLANMLPWIKVTRCLFIYHYMPAYSFTWLALAWIVDRLLASSTKSDSRLQIVGVAIIASIVLAFVFWLPIYFGLPLSREANALRMWFNNWI